MTVPSVALAGFVAWVAWNDWTLLSHGSPVPAETKLVDLTPAGANGNVHVRVTNFRFASDYVASVLKSGRWQTVWIPLLADGNLRAVVRTARVPDPNELAVFVKQPELTGIVSDRIVLWPEGWQIAELHKKHPGVDIGSLPLILEGRPFPTFARLWTLIGVFTVAVIWPFAFLWWTAGWRRHDQFADDVMPGFTGEMAEGLGEVQRKFARDPQLVGGLNAAIFLIVLMGTIMVFVYLSPGSGPRVGILIFLVLFEVFLWSLVIGYILYRHDAAILCSNGIVVQYRRTTTACRWGEVESATGLVRKWFKFHKTPMLLGGPLRFRCHDGKIVKVGILKDELELVNAIREQLSPRLLARAVEAIKNGETVAIGPLIFERTGISGPKNSWLPWSEVGDAYQHDDRPWIVIPHGNPPGEWWHGSISMPNGALLMDLVAAGRRGELS
jgi:hypothetical protein